MPLITCGGMRFQYKWKDLKADQIPEDVQKKLESSMWHALECGVIHFETARGYGSSEVQMGMVLPKMNRDQILVQTKVGPTDNPREFLAQFDQSLRNLNLEYVDLLAIHGINDSTTLHQSLRDGGCLEMARRLQSQGRARYVGFSTHAPLDIILQAIETGGFDYVNLHWYFVNQSNREALEEAQRRGMGVLIISPNDKGGKLYEPSDKLLRLCAPLHPMEFNDLFTWSHPAVHTLSMGLSRKEDLDLHVQALQGRSNPEQVDAIAGRLHAEMIHMLGEDWCLHWDEGLPVWEAVPGGVNIREILRLWTWAKGLDMVGYGKMRYNLLGNGGHWFPGNKAAVVHDEAIRRACHSNRFSSDIPGILREAHELFNEVDRKRLSQSD